MNPDSFRKLKYSLEIENFRELQEEIRNGTLSGEYPFGVFLELLRFGDETLDSMGAENIELVGLEKLYDISSRFGLEKNPEISFFQGVSEKMLYGFAEEFKGRDWNPEYAPVRNYPLVRTFCAEHKPEKVISEFNVYKDDKECLVYPFSGWSLARYIGMSFDDQDLRI